MCCIKASPRPGSSSTIGRLRTGSSGVVPTGNGCGSSSCHLRRTKEAASGVATSLPSSATPGIAMSTAIVRDISTSTGLAATRCARSAIMPSSTARSFVRDAGNRATISRPVSMGKATGRYAGPASRRKCGRPWYSGKSTGTGSGTNPRRTGIPAPIQP